MHRIGFVGLGVMGEPMAVNLIRIRDKEPPRLNTRARDSARRFAEENVRRVKELIFPRHGL